MTERPVIFNGEMVRAILSGKKTQTRRTITAKTLHLFDVAAKVGECHHLNSGDPADERSQPYYRQFCPFGQPGDRLWVKETFATGLCTKSTIAYRATHKPSDLDEGWDEQIKWTPSIHMSRSFSRIKLEITAVRVERLNDISEQDALAEGMDDGTSPAAIAAGWFEKPRRAFRRLWERIYGQESWDSNPWVWVVEFKQVQS
ncbi:MAG: hypothetical protein RR874_20115 [Aeromonas sp.]|uniref:hypothetical protein n=1 Tax=Aeromonas sp. TaxID=647 RepID=UPI002FCC23BA